MQSRPRIHLSYLNVYEQRVFWPLGVAISIANQYLSDGTAYRLTRLRVPPIMHP